MRKDLAEQRQEDERPILWLVSFPRSGNTFLRNILKEVYGIDSGEYHEDDSLSKVSLDDYDVIKTHLSESALQPLSDIDKVVLLVRDGRDCMVSIAHHKMDIVEPGTSFENNLQEAILSEKGSYFGGWSQNVDSWINRANVVIRYEDLISNPLEEVERIRGVFDLPQPMPERLPTFENLKHGGDNISYGKGEIRVGHMEARTEAYTSKFYRRGIAGSWKDEMNEDMHLLFWNQHGDAMRRLGYNWEGNIDSPSTLMEFDLCQKLNLNLQDAPPRKILIEASKLADEGNDGIKRYVQELVSQFGKINLQNSPWSIDLYIHGKKKPLSTYYPVKKRVRYLDAEEVLEKHTEAENNLIELSLEDQHPHTKVEAWKQRTKQRMTKLAPGLDTNPLFVFGKRILHQLFLAAFRMRDGLVAIRSNSRHHSIQIRNWLKDNVLMPIVNVILTVILKIAELIVHFVTITVNLSREKKDKLSDDLQTHRLREGIKDIYSWIDGFLQIGYAKYDLVFATLPQNARPFSGVRSPLVTTIHDFTHETHKEFHRPENVYNARLGFDLIDRKKKSHFISISDHTTEDIKRFMSPNHSVRKVSEAANGNHFRVLINHDDLSEVKRKYGIDCERYIITLSTIEPRKNIITAVKAFKAYIKKSGDPITKMVITGRMGWGEDKFDELEKEVAELKDRFAFTGFVDDEDLPLLLNGARVMCYVSLYEGFGLPILEAYKCGLPVICGRNSSQIEVAGEHGMLVDAMDHKAVTELLDKVINDDQFYYKQRQESLKHAENYSWYKAARETLEYFENLLSS